MFFSNTGKTKPDYRIQNKPEMKRVQTVKETQAAPIEICIEPVVGHSR
ncbi:MAG: hypothetical protein RBT01_14595 [Anaerolineaceae bacterium]|nr:hypothetical protein [Anaerolineaceae bacterium]